MTDTPITHDELMDALSTIGKTVGFAISTSLAAALTKGGIADSAIPTFQASIGAFADSDQLTPYAGILLQGIVDGVDAFHAAPDDLDDLEELF